MLRPALTGSSIFQLLIVGGFGAACLYGAVWNLVKLGGEGTIGAFLVLLVIGLLIVGALAMRQSGRTVLDGSGIHVHMARRNADFPWPTSRTGFFARISIGRTVSEAAVHLVTEEGKAVPLTGLSWMGPLPRSLEAKAVAQCSRIWDWAIAQGYTQETSFYVPLKGVTQQGQQVLREEQERRFNLR